MHGAEHNRNAITRRLHFKTRSLDRSDKHFLNSGGSRYSDTKNYQNCNCGLEEPNMTAV